MSIRTVTGESQRQGALEATERSLITVLGVVEGEVLELLESRGPTPLYRLIQAAEWPASLVMMAVGALIRQGLVCGNEHGSEIVVEATRMTVGR